MTLYLPPKTNRSQFANLKTDFGAQGNNIGDDSLATINAFTFVANNGGGIIGCPPGRYRLTGPLLYPPNSLFTKFASLGPPGSAQFIVGGSGHNGLEMRGSAWCGFENMAILTPTIGAKQWDNLVALTAPLASSPSAEDMLVHNCEFSSATASTTGNCEADNLLALGTDYTNGNNDISAFSGFNIRCQNANMAGFIAGAGVTQNVLANFLSHYTASHCQWGLQYDGGGIVVDGVDFGTNFGADIYVSHAVGTQVMGIRNIRSEGSNRALLSANQGGSTNYFQLILDGYNFDLAGLNADSRVFNYGWSGLVTVRDFVGHGIAPGGNPNFLLNSGNLQSIFDNCALPTALDTAFNLNGGGEIRNYVQTNTSGVAVVRTSRHHSQAQSFAAPVLTPGAALGAAGTAVIGAGGRSDSTTGFVTLASDPTTTTTGILFTLTFDATFGFGTIPNVKITPMTDNASGLHISVTTTSLGFSVRCTVAPAINQTNINFKYDVS